MARSFLILLLLLVSCGNEREKEKTYIIGRDKTWESLELLGKDLNLLAFTDDLLYMISSAQDLPIQIENVSKGSQFRFLDRRELDAVVSYASPSRLNLENYIYTQPFFLLGPVLIVRKDNDAISIADMKNRVVGVQTGSDLDFDQNTAPGVIFRPYANMLDALRSLSQGQIDGVILEALPAYEYTTSFYRDALKIIPPPLTDDGLRLVALNKPEEKELIEKFNQGLIQMIENGEYRKLVEKWNLRDPAKDYYEKIKSTQ